jgi:hypothetical protein
VWLGAADGTEYSDGRSLIFDCECGVAECGGTFARISFSDHEVIWSKIGRTEQTSIGPFRFDREQYEAAVATIASA